MRSEYNLIFVLRVFDDAARIQFNLQAWTRGKSTAGSRCICTANVTVGRFRFYECTPQNMRKKQRPWFKRCCSPSNEFSFESKNTHQQSLLFVTENKVSRIVYIKSAHVEMASYTKQQTYTCTIWTTAQTVHWISIFIQVKSTIIKRRTC